MAKRIRVFSNTPLAEALGFDKTKFYGHFDIENLDEGGHKIILMYVLSLYPGEGNVQRLFDFWIESGFDIDVDRPNQVMMHIITEKKFRQSPLYSELWQYKKVWNDGKNG